MDGYEKLMEQYDEAAFALMMDRSAEEEGAELLRMFREASDAGALPEYSDALDLRCRDAIEREFGKRTRRVRLRRFGQSLVRAAVLVFAMIGLAGTLIMSVEAWRAPFLNFIIEEKQTHSVIHGENDSGDNSMPEGVSDYLLGLLPEGYYQSNQHSDDTTHFVSYKNETGDTVQFLISTIDGIHNIDTEDASCSEIELNDYKAYFIDKNGYRVIWCNDENIMYDIRATGFDMDTFLAICNELAEHYK